MGRRCEGYLFIFLFFEVDVTRAAESKHKLPILGNRTKMCV